MSIRIFISTVWWSGRFFKLTNSHMLIHKVTGWIQIDSELHVKPFYKWCSVPFPQWFRQVQDCWLLRKSMLENFTVYLYTWNRVLKTFLLHLMNYRNICLQRNLFTQPNIEICITIAMCIHSVIPNSTRILSITAILIIA